MSQDDYHFLVPSTNGHYHNTQTHHQQQQQQQQQTHQTHQTHHQPNEEDIADSATSSSKLDRLWRRRPFVEGEDILLEGQDGLMYFGIVVEVDQDVGQCLIRFGDCTEKWSPFFDLRRLGEDEEEEEEAGEDFESETISSSNVCEEEIEEIESFGIREFEDEDDLPLQKLLKKKKRKRKRLKGEEQEGCDLKIKIQKRIKITKKKKTPQHVIEARKELPYDFDKLNWDENHQRNDVDRYCYCGESGDWYKKMLQCDECLQWFHQGCLRKSTTPLLFGDRFFEFECGLCTGKVGESITRLDMTWVEALHLVLFNLTVINSKKFHDLETSVVPFFKRKWKSLQGPNCVLKSSRIDQHYFAHLLCSNKSRFKCGSEIKKRSTFWGLRKVMPPAVKGCESSNNLLNNINYKCKVETKKQKLKRQQQQQKIHSSIRGKRASKMVPPSCQPQDINMLNKTLNNYNGSSHGKKRGRPPRSSNSASSKRSNKKNFLDSCDLSDSSSRGTLESFIPPPKNFEGFNNPFRNLGLCPFEPPSVLLKLVTNDSSPHVKANRKFSGKTNGLLMIGGKDSSTQQQATANQKKPDISNTVEEESTHPDKLLSDLKSSLHSYFGAETRIAKGERFNVMARRLNVDGDTQYLLEWEQPNPLSPTVMPNETAQSLSQTKLGDLKMEEQLKVGEVTHDCQFGIELV